jgi:hypothetical protein
MRPHSGRRSSRPRFRAKGDLVEACSVNVTGSPSQNKPSYDVLDACVEGGPINTAEGDGCCGREGRRNSMPDHTLGIKQFVLAKSTQRKSVARSYNILEEKVSFGKQSPPGSTRIIEVQLEEVIEGSSRCATTKCCEAVISPYDNMKKRKELSKMRVNCSCS